MRHPWLRPRIAARWLIWFLGTTAFVPPTIAAAPIEFGRDIQPLLAQRCFRCHGPDKAEGGLRLSSRDAALTELASGSRAIVPGMPGESVLLDRIGASDADVRMPPEGKPLTPQQIARLRQWIEEGAKWQRPWAFELPAAPPVPEVHDRAWIRGPIDAFILARLEEQELPPAAPATPVALVRRLFYDLTGLPPTPGEVDAFVADRSDEAYDRLVDRLLASPHYGERWGRHWLDLVRFAETYGHEFDFEIPGAHAYRDYVIRAFNADVPYDRLVIEHVAGDLLARPRLHPSERFNESIIGT
ncbi:MAG TPA: DUF1549 domain-containing protein, partial [Pirellulales bacterium]|nr:DUF1549 domain-containing protein [Pirellulales bacterium]